MNDRRHFLCMLGGVVALPPLPAHSQTYPSRHITLVVPFAAGGGNDIVARITAEKMSRTLGQQIVVENRPGAGGTIAIRQVAKSPPDGHTLLLGSTGTLAIAPSVYSNAGYDPRKDFAPIGLIATSPLVLLVHPSMPAQSVRELVALAKQRPGGLSYASAGAGSITHLTPELFASMAEIKMTHIPNRGVAPAITDVLGGHASMVFSALPPSVALIKEGRLRALAVSSTSRTELLPEVPTISESGLPGYKSIQRFGLLVPAMTPRSTIDKLNAALNEALALDDVRSRIVADGAEPRPSTPDEYAAHIDLEEAKWSKVVRDVGARLQ